MPKYRIELSDGRKFDIEADQPPTEADVLAALGQQQQQAAPEKPPTAADILTGQSRDAQAVNKSPGARFVSGLATALPTGLVTTAQDVSKGHLKTAREHFAKGNYLRAMAHLAGAGFPGPEVALRLAQGIDQYAEQQSEASAKAALSGDIPGAIEHAVYGVPVAGAMVGDVAETAKRGDVAGAVGKTIVNVAPALIPKRVANVQTPGVLRNPDPAGAANTAWAIEQGLPVELAGASGNEYVKAVQAAGRGSLLGSGPTRVMNIAQTGELRGYGNALAGQTGVRQPVTPVQVGRGVLEDVTKLRNQIRTGAKEKYGEAEMLAALADPEFMPTAEHITAGMKARAEHTLGRPVSVEDLQGLRRILAEMESQPFTKHTFDESGQITLPGGAGAKVFDDIVAGIPSRRTVDPQGKVSFTTPNPSRGDVIASLKRAISTGHFTDAAKSAMGVVGQRMQPGSFMAAKAELPPSAGLLAPTEMQVPVDRRPIKDLLRADYEAQKKLLAITRKQADPGFTALAQFMEGPDDVPYIDFERDLGTFKGILRGGKKVADTDALKTPSQRLAAKAVAAMEPISDAKAASVPGLREAMTEARGQYAQMFPVEQTREALARRGPLSRTRLLTQADDANVELLRTVQEQAPQRVPEIARSKLDELMRTTFETGGGGGAAKAKRTWDKMGEETKAILFPDAKHRDNVGQFLELMAKRQENINPSGSTFMALKVGEAGGLFFHPTASQWGFSALLGGAGVAMMSPEVVKLLVQGMKIPVKHTAAAAALNAQLNKALQAAQQQAGQQPPQTP